MWQTQLQVSALGCFIQARMSSMWIQQSAESGQVSNVVTGYRRIPGTFLRALSADNLWPSWVIQEFMFSTKVSSKYINYVSRWDDTADTPTALGQLDKRFPYLKRKFLGYLLMNVFFYLFFPVFVPSCDIPHSMVKFLLPSPIEVCRSFGPA